MLKKNLILLFILLTTECFAYNYFTAQTPDVIEYEGKEYVLNSNPLEPYFEKYPDKRPQGGIMSTALWRGYVAKFKIIDNILYAIDVEIEVPDKDFDKDYKTKLISVFDKVFPEVDKMKIDWYTGILIIPHGELVNYVHMGYASTYSKYWLLEIKLGNLIESRQYRNKEYVEFKQRQFEAFKKTEEYKKIYDELKESDSSLNDEFLENFLSNFIINYTSEFLTD